VNRGPARPEHRPLEWRDDEQGFAPEVRELAAEFGYS
jgi:hypothetical protein